MHIVHGEKVVRRHEGWVVSFCPLCRCVQAHEVRSVGIAAHVYLMQVSKAHPKHFELVCEGCRIVTSARTMDLRKSAIKSERPAAGPVDPERYPWPVDKLHNRLALEQRLKERRLSAKDRAYLLREPFRTVTYTHAVSMRQGGWVSVMSVALLVLSVCAITTIALWVMLAGEPKPPWLLKICTYSMTVAAVGAASVCAWLYVSLPRLASRRWRGAVLRALEPLAVSPEELEESLRSMDQQRMSPARALRGSDLASHFATARVVPVTPGKAY